MRYVYFAQASTAGGIRAIKIGVAGKPWSRVRELQCGSPTRIRLLAYVEGDERLERKLHATFEPVGLRGEWFARQGKLSDFLGYLENYADENCLSGLVSFEQFETSIGDNIANDSWMPVMQETEDEYEATANRSLWAEYE